MPIKIKKDSELFINNRNYLFKPNRSGACYYLINGDFFLVQIRNDSDLPMKVFKRYLDIFKEFME